jgi:hypothetical protein
MKNYVQNIVNKLAEFSEKLDNTALFVEMPWVVIDTNSDYHKYIFKKNGELILSINGQVQLGKWEYLASAKSILIDRVKEKVLLNQFFFDSAVMVLRIDGSSDHFFILANERLIPDLDVQNYLQNLMYIKLDILTSKLKNGKTLEVHRGHNNSMHLIGTKATIDGEHPIDGKYELNSSKRYYEIRNGQVFKITYPVNYKTSDGLIITIEQEINSKSISVGDLAYIDKKPAKTGRYKLGLFKTIKVENGVIVRKSIF